MLTIYELISAVIFFTAILSYLNYKFLKLPDTVGLLLLSLVIGVGVVLLVPASGMGHIRSALAGVDFNRTLLQGMLSILLFAGGLQIQLPHLHEQARPVAVLSTFGVVLSAFLVAVLLYFVLALLGIPIPFISCLLFGALISPTDPVAVLSIIHTTPLSKSIQTLIAGESLFNDGTGIILFSIVYSVAFDGQMTSPGMIGKEILLTIGGGFLAGGLIAMAIYWLLRTVDDYKVEILVTLGLTLAGYAIAHRLHFSGPLAMVVAGIIVGNYARISAMSVETRRELDGFWVILDWIINAVLFVLIGIQIILMPFSPPLVLMTGIAIVAVFFSRWCTIYASGRLFSLAILKHAQTRNILLLGGLRGGISIALALSIPEDIHREHLILMTYAVVVVSIIAQGLLFVRLSRRLDVVENRAATANLQ